MFNSHPVKFLAKMVVFIMTISLSGCAFDKPLHQSKDSNNQSSCRFIERNLTVAWDKRSYWCVPEKSER